MPSSPPVTVILPAHNAELTIAAAIASTLNQTYTDFELWVLENGSNDSTAEIARSVCDGRVKVFELGAVGVHGALQYALENARSPWLARMDADDLMFPSRLEIQMGFIRKNPNVAFVGTANALLLPSGAILEPVLTSSSRQVTKDLLALQKRFFADPSIVFNRQIAIEAGGADMEFPRGGDGVTLLFRLLTKGIGWELAEHLHLYRVQAHSRSRRADYAEQLRRVRLKYAPEYATHYKRLHGTIDGGWSTIAGLELLAGQAKAVRQAASLIRPVAPRTAHRLWTLSYLGVLGRALYKWRKPPKWSLRRRSDWERLFSPLLLESQEPQPRS